ncbi:MAG: NYN domain-containing protein [Ignavibacteriaceae bacterium]|jgi:predicted RNA-binding protein with PIN domain
MKHFIIDGNNVIGKIKFLKSIQKSNKQQSRLKLAFLIDNYFHAKKVKVTIHFDGFENEPIKLNNCKIIYSQNRTADEKIKHQIESGSNPKNMIIVTSDNNLREFARKCSCTLQNSEEFANNLMRKDKDDEADKIDRMSKDIDEFKRIFGVDED